MTTAFMIEEKNKVASSNPTLTLLEIVIPDTSPQTVRIVENNEAITWRGETWQALPMQWDEIVESSKGEIPRVDFSISNVNRELEYYIQAYDLYCKLNGFSPIVVTIYCVNAGNLANTNPEVEYTFELKDVRSTSQWATFTLGAASPYNQRCPLDRIMKNHGRVKKFQDLACGYSGAETSCDRTLAQCRTYGNSGRYCGFPGAGNTGLRI